MKKEILIVAAIALIFLTGCARPQVTDNSEIKEPEEINVTTDDNYDTSEIAVDEETKKELMEKREQLLAIKEAVKEQNEEGKDNGNSSEHITMEPLFEKNCDNGSFAKIPCISGSDSEASVRINKELSEMAANFNDKYQDSDVLCTISDLSFENDRYINILLLINEAENYGMGSFYAVCYDKVEDKDISIEECMDKNMISMENIEYNVSDYFSTKYSDSMNKYIGMTEIYGLMDDDNVPVYYFMAAIDNENTGTWISMNTLKYDGDYPIIEDYTPY